MNKRLEKVQEILKTKNIDAFVTTNTYNQFYLTNFTGSTSITVITQTDAYFITDGRYIVQSENEVEENDYNIIIISKNYDDELHELLISLKIATLAVEENNITLEKYFSLKKVMDENNISIMSVSNIVEDL